MKRRSSVSAPGHWVVGCGAAPQPLLGFLDWFNAGRLPGIILLTLCLVAFVAVGFPGQLWAQSMLGHPLPSIIAVPAAVLLAIAIVRVAGPLIARALPRDETEAVSSDEFIGQAARITIGRARRGAPAEAKLRDRFGQIHYVMVEPDREGDEFSAGQSVTLLRRQGGTYRVIDNPAGFLEES